MKRLLIITLLIIAGRCLYAQTYIPAGASSEVTFTIKNFGLSVNGSFKGLKGTIVFTAANPASVNVTLDAATVNTGNGSRDRHLKKDDYFDTEKYSTLSFVSTKITSAGKAGAYNMLGNLTIKGTSKAVSFPFTATAITNGYQLQGQFKINRRDFNVGGSSWVLSDDLTVSLNVSIIKQ
jgi:polyisoprenoid-binding protein YceI